MTERNSSRTENPFPFPFEVDDNHEEEKIEGPKALERPPEGNVREPDLRRLLRSVTAEVATVEATEVAWRNVGRGGARLFELAVEPTGACL